MKITSNIEKVVGRLRKLRDAVPLAQAAVLLPEPWEEVAAATARGILNAIARDEEIRFIGPFVDAIRVHGFTMGFSLSLTWRPSANPIEQAQASRASIAEGSTGPLFTRPIEELEQLVEEWVNTPEEEGGKRLDERDAGKSAEDIAHLITYILTTPTPGPLAEAARAGLIPHVTAFLEARQGGAGLSAARTDEWLRAVLVAWRERVRKELPARFKLELKRQMAA